MKSRPVYCTCEQYFDLSDNWGSRGAGKCLIIVTRFYQRGYDAHEWMREGASATVGAGLDARDSAWIGEMIEKTTRKYRDSERLPSQRTSERSWRTRHDPFADVWDPVRRRFEAAPRLKAKTLFEWLQQAHEGRFPDSTRRIF